VRVQTTEGRLVRSPSTRVSSLYLVRHAHADWSADENRPLSTQGRIAARRVAEILGSVPIDGLYSSPARRARDTVSPLAARLGLPIFVEPDLRERQLGSPATGFEQAVEATWRDPLFAYPGGESNAAAQQRGVVVVYRLLQHAGTHWVLATHGNLLALVLQHFDPTVGFPFWQSLTMPDIYRLTLSDPGSPAIERLWQH
jgi:2,3-bisphosphoglycerate-dependent phosphoglycerate mutase